MIALGPGQRPLSPGAFASASRSRRPRDSNPRPDSIAHTDPSPCRGKTCGHSGHRSRRRDPPISRVRRSTSRFVRLPGWGRGRDTILRLYPHIENADINQALAYAASRAEEIEAPLVSK